MYYIIYYIIFANIQGQISEGTDVVDFLMEQPNVVPRINPFILSSDRRYLDFTASPGNTNKSVNLGISMQRFLTFSL